MNGQFQRPPNLQQIQQNQQQQRHRGGVYYTQQQRARQAQLWVNDPPRQTAQKGSGEVVKSAAFFGTVGFLLGGPAGAVVGGVVGGILGKAFGK